jgi:hypothetical protein
MSSRECTWIANRGWDFKKDVASFMHNSIFRCNRRFGSFASRAEIDVVAFDTVVAEGSRVSQKARRRLVGIELHLPWADNRGGASCAGDIRMTDCFDTGA